MNFTKATRKQVKLKLAITGPSGSGKTWGALALAKGLGGRVAVIDTENGSASLYADRFEFDVIELSAPFSPTKYIEALGAAVAAGYDVVVIDSISHEWNAEGGILDVKNQKDIRGGNSFTNWAGPSAEHEKFKQALLQSPVHVLATMRSKVEYVIDQASAGDGKTKATPRKVGLAPVQRADFEYEFSIVFDIAIDGHEAVASKDRTSLFDGRHFKLSAEIGKELASWLGQGSAYVAPPKPRSEPISILQATAVPPAFIADEDVFAPTKPAPKHTPPVDDPGEMRMPAAMKKNGGKKLSELSTNDLKFWAEAFAKNAADPAKARWADENAKLAAGCRAELAGRPG